MYTLGNRAWHILLRFPLWLAAAAVPAMAENTIEVRCRAHARAHLIDADGLELQESLEPLPEANGRHRFEERTAAYYRSLPPGVDFPTWIAPPPGATLVETDNRSPIVLEPGSGEDFTVNAYRVRATPRAIEQHYRRILASAGYQAEFEGWSSPTPGLPGAVANVSFRRGRAAVQVFAESKSGGEASASVTYRLRAVGRFRPPPSLRLVADSFDGNRLFLRNRDDGSRFTVSHDVIEGEDSATPVPQLPRASLPRRHTPVPGAVEELSHGGGGSNIVQWKTAAAPREALRHYRALFAKNGVKNGAVISGQQTGRSDGDPVYWIFARDPASGGDISVQTYEWEDATTVSVQFYDFRR